jgi:hypothetical protein
MPGNWGNRIFLTLITSDFLLKYNKKARPLPWDESKPAIPPKFVKTHFQGSHKPIALTRPYVCYYSGRPICRRFGHLLGSDTTSGKPTDSHQPSALCINLIPNALRHRIINIIFYYSCVSCFCQSQLRDILKQKQKFIFFVGLFVYDRKL